MADAERAVEALPSALGNVDEIRARAGGRELVTFLDFDGTLAPIVARPNAVALPAATRGLLERLARRHKLAIVSGRGLDDLCARVGLEALYYAGDHGFSLAGPGGVRREYEGIDDLLPLVGAAREALECTIGAIPGVVIEPKRFSVAIHYRGAPRERVHDVRTAVMAERARRVHLRLVEGRQVFELRPEVDWDKGRVLEWFDEVLGLTCEQRLRIYVGDDATDEDAFRAVAHDGVGVLVRGRGSPTSYAHYELESPEAVRDFLVALLDG